MTGSVSDSGESSKDKSDLNIVTMMTRMMMRMDGGLNGTNKKAMGGFGARLGGALKISYRHSSQLLRLTILHPNLHIHTAQGSNVMYCISLGYF